MSRAIRPTQIIRKWKALAAFVHPHFRLSAESRQAALSAARAHPDSALRVYAAIARSLVAR